MSDLSILGTTVTGTDGAAGLAAIPPTTPGASAPAAGTGGVGGDATNAMMDVNITTSNAPQTTMTATGGFGGAGGAAAGAPGADFSSTLQEFFYEGSHDYYLDTFQYGDGGRGGDGGNDGNGGSATTSLSSATFTAPTFQFELVANGGGIGNYLGAAAAGGAGGSAGSNYKEYGYSRSGAVVLMRSDTGGTGGAGGSGGRGGNGGKASANLQKIALASAPGSDGTAGFYLSAEGFSGSGGGSGGAGGWGAVAGRGGDGGSGGSGGAGVASVTGVSVSQQMNGSAYSYFQLKIDSLGGDGAAGGNGGSAGVAESRSDGPAGSTDIGHWGVSGNGGTGGNGGNVSASFDNNTISTAGGIFLTLTALAGAGGKGGASGYAGENLVGNGGTITAGTPGANGQAGVGRISFTNNVLNATGAASTMNIQLSIGPYSGQFVTLNAGAGGNFEFSGNTLNGGGTGTLDLYAQGSPVLINNQLGEVSIGGSVANTLTGFTSFATEGATTFVLGKGAATYDAAPYDSSVADHFVVGRGHGNATVDNATYGGIPVIEFHNYGSALNSFAQVLADASDATGELVIATPDGASITFGGPNYLSLSDLTASDFQFTNSTPVTASLVLTGTAESLTGSALANTTVTVTEGATIVGSTTSNAAGQWSFTPTGLAAGLHTLTASETDSYGYALSAKVANVIGGPVLALTSGIDHVTGGAASDTILAKTSTLSGGDSIDGGAGSNTLMLLGGGTFNLAAPTTLVNVQTLAAQEGQGATAQTVTLRAGLNLTVRVASDTNGDATPGITIIGATNADVITLGSGNDTVVLGAGETVNAGSGASAITVNAANETVNEGTGHSTISVSTSGLGATIHGGAHNTLVITGGGTAALGANISGIGTVRLASTTNFSTGLLLGLQISGSAAGHDTITLGAASDSVVAGGTHELVRASAANASARVSGLGAGSTLEITSGGTLSLNAATGGSAAAPLTVQLDAATHLTLSAMQFLHAVGSTGADTITGKAINQTLTGRLGADLLTGYAGGHDLFQDTIAGLQSDKLAGFVATDRIDVTNLGAVGAKLTATTSGGNTAVTIVSGASKVSFAMAGSFTQSGFAIASDGSTGLLLTHS